MLKTSSYVQHPPLGVTGPMTGPRPMGCMVNRNKYILNIVYNMVETVS